MRVKLWMMVIVASCFGVGCATEKKATQREGWACSQLDLAMARAAKDADGGIGPLEGTLKLKTSQEGLVTLTLDAAQAALPRRMTWSHDGQPAWVDLLAMPTWLGPQQRPHVYMFADPLRVYLVAFHPEAGNFSVYSSPLVEGDVVAWSRRFDAKAVALIDQGDVRFDLRTPFLAEQDVLIWGYVQDTPFMLVVSKETGQVQQHCKRP